jgi:hypothetical protein
MHQAQSQQALGDMREARHKPSLQVLLRNSTNYGRVFGDRHRMCALVLRGQRESAERLCCGGRGGQKFCEAAAWLN